MTIYVLSGFNNYYNRIVKKFDTVREYEQFILHTQQNYNFVPSDGVNTQVVLGNLGNQYNGEGDYLLVVNEFNEIVSRWFIIESMRDRAGQFTLTLHRDLVVDHYDEVIDAPMFIEKASLSINDPFIYNKENMTFNQIKTSETLLKDQTGCPWIVGYYSKNQETMQVTVPLNEDVQVYETLPVPIAQWDLYKYSQEDWYPGEIVTADYYIRAFYTTLLAINPHMVQFATNWKSGYTENYPISLDLRGSNIEYVDEAYEIRIRYYLKEAYEEVGLDTLEDLLKANGVNWNDKTTLDNNFLRYVGKTVRDADGKYFKITLGDVKSVHKETKVTVGSNLFEKMKEVINKVTDFIRKDANEHSFLVYNEVKHYQLKFEDVSTEQGVYVDFGTGRVQTEDAPWNIFAIPYGELTVNNNGNFLVTTTADIAIKTAASANKQFPLIIHDIQILPYCPIPDIITGKGTINLTNNNQFDTIRYKDDDENIQTLGVILHCPLSKFNTTLTQYTIPQAQSAIDKKINNECDKWRLASPSYASYFDFSVEMNNGINYFDVDCEYKPFTPYIHVNPDFGGLYGYDDNSPRGLILSGDFSISQIIDQWEQYQIQNKNFQNIFDRQIENLEVQHSVGRTQDIASVITGIGAGAAAGGLAGSSIAPGVGTTVGAIAGGVLSAGAGIADIFINEKLRNETLDYTKDMFGYQLGNIQALPNTISKVSAYNPNNKIFPVLEYYTCTNEEKKALVNKLAWNGMTTMRIGTMNEFVGNSWTYNDIESKGYIKGKLIRLETVEDDYHIINELSNELNRGVYI